MQARMNTGMRIFKALSTRARLKFVDLDANELFDRKCKVLARGMNRRAVAAGGEMVPLNAVELSPRQWAVHVPPLLELTVRHT